MPALKCQGDRPSSKGAHMSSRFIYDQFLSLIAHIVIRDQSKKMFS
jgi:hypothetical protein